MAIIQLMGGAEAGVADFAIAAGLVTVAGITIDCAARQEDGEQHIELRQANGVVAESASGAYVAILVVPARRYREEPITDDEGNPAVQLVPEPLDPNAVVVKLWPFAAPTPIAV